MCARVCVCLCVACVCVAKHHPRCVGGLYPADVRSIPMTSLDHAEPQPVAASATPLIEAEAGLKAANHQKAVYSKPRCNESTRGTKASLSVATVNLWRVKHELKLNYQPTNTK